MKRLFSANTPADEGSIRLLKSALEAEGIPCMVRNELLSIGKGDIPAPECVPELWVLDDKDFPKAQMMVDEWRRADATPQASWSCPQCRETLEGQFASCWKCGRERPEA